MLSNLFADLPFGLPSEIVTTLIEYHNLRVERIVSHGHCSPEGFWYDQDEHEWVVVLRGKAKVAIDGGAKELGPGDFLNIPAHRRHRVEWTTPDEPTIWLAIFYSGDSA
jgi:cupin 2 domain-containing protein